MRNKKYIFMSALAVMALSATAQDFDNTPTLNINNKEKQVKFTVGARFMADAAYYNTEATPLKSGATISDARIRTSMSYGENWYFYADFGFGGGKFSQKNIFLQYANKADKGTHAVKVGYYNDQLEQWLLRLHSVLTTSSLVQVWRLQLVKVVNSVSLTSSQTIISSLIRACSLKALTTVWTQATMA